MGIIRDAILFGLESGKTALKQGVVERSFYLGQNALPPSVAFSDTESGRELQALADKAYEEGRKSVINKGISKITNKITE